MSEIHVGDIGTQIILTITDNRVAKDISNASSRVFRFSDPSGNTFDRNASFYTNGEDGKLRYNLASGDIDEAGVWHVQAIITTPNGTWHSEVLRVQVRANLSNPA